MLPYLFLSCPRTLLVGADRDDADLFIELCEGLALRYGKLLMPGDGEPDLERPRYARCMVAIPIRPCPALYAELHVALEAKVPVVLIWPERHPLPTDVAGHPLVVEVRRRRTLGNAFTEFRQVLRAMRDRASWTPAEDGPSVDRVLH